MNKMEILHELADQYHALALSHGVTDTTGLSPVLWVPDHQGKLHAYRFDQLPIRTATSLLYAIANLAADKKLPSDDEPTDGLPEPFQAGHITLDDGTITYALHLSPEWVNLYGFTIYATPFANNLVPRDWIA